MWRGGRCHVWTSGVSHPAASLFTYYFSLIPFHSGHGFCLAVESVAVAFGVAFPVCGIFDLAAPFAGDPWADEAVGEVGDEEDGGHPLPGLDGEGEDDDADEH